ncbi:hydantoinase/oxoprolinase family protein [Luedemannella helvata]|uniref:Hydantoinase/oxoprolinase family protein n=1 Tax=Luedemannella helvata TaxID=349315 RepID=A0ABP4VXK7_9ACTN
MYRLGVDVGGTFTDVLLIEDATGKTRRTKVPSTPQDQSVGVIEGVTRILADAAARAADVSQFLHGTTVATNAVLERRGARVGLVVTVGYRQVLHIARSFVPGGLGGWIVWDRPAELVALDDVREVPGRMDFQGNQIEPLDESAVRAAVRQLVDRGVDALAIGFVNSYANPAHELRAAEIAAQEAPGVPVSTSAGVLPELGEYERTLTTVANAYVRPGVGAYLRNLSAKLVAEGLVSERRVLRSDGGLMTFERAEDIPVSLLMSGPAGGVAAAVALGPAAGFRDLLTLDMGGTSTDVALIENGTPVIRRETTVADLAVRAPSIDVQTVGAGGGSIAHVPELTGALRVGPASAGALPGPATYGRGGVLPTVTDANVVLGYLPQALLGGAMPLDVEKARTAVGTVATKLGISVEAAAAAIIDIVNENMLGALRLVSVQRGYDPRRFALFGFGGAGPLHANALAKLLGSWPVVIPQSPGVLCAYGDASTGVRAEANRSIVRRLDEFDEQQLQAEFADLAGQIETEFDRAGVPADARIVRFEADVRYHGQGFEVPVDVGTARDGALIPKLRSGFDEAHERLFGFAIDEPHEIVNIRAVGTSGDVKIKPVEIEHGGPDAQRAVMGRQQVYVNGAWQEALLYDRTALRAGNELPGPAIVVEMDSTSLILPGCVARVDKLGNLVILPAENGVLS